MSLDVYLTAVRPTEVFSANYTHNVGRMAEAAGLYQAVWHPHEIGITKAGQLAPLLRAGIERMECHPETYTALNPKNGWGSYETFVPWLKAYADACEAHPDADIRTSV